jgi:hypothetical protein
MLHKYTSDSELRIGRAGCVCLGAWALIPVMVHVYVDSE